MNKISTNLWFDDQTEEAANFYISVFGDGKLGRVLRYSEAGQEIHGHQPGSVMTIDFELLGQEFVGLNGGPMFQFTPAISFMVNCATVEEVNELWEKLHEGNQKVLMELDSYPFSKRYGWLEDKYGVSWQIAAADGGIEQRIVPSLLFVGDKCGQAESAVQFYASVFKDAQVGLIARYGADQAPDTEGTVMFADLTLEGQKFSAMDSARDHAFDFTEAISFIINCKDQEEVDYYWNKLSAVPDAEQCGWLKDKYGVSWQVIPTEFLDLITNSDAEKASKVMGAMLQMKKLDIAGLKAAAES